MGRVEGNTDHHHDSPAFGDQPSGITSTSTQHARCSKSRHSKAITCTGTHKNSQFTFKFSIIDQDPGAAATARHIRIHVGQDTGHSTTAEARETHRSAATSPTAIRQHIRGRARHEQTNHSTSSQSHASLRITYYFSTRLGQQIRVRVHRHPRIIHPARQKTWCQDRSQQAQSQQQPKSTTVHTGPQIDHGNSRESSTRSHSSPGKSIRQSTGTDAQQQHIKQQSH